MSEQKEKDGFGRRVIEYCKRDKSMLSPPERGEKRRSWSPWRKNKTPISGTTASPAASSTECTNAVAQQLAHSSSSSAHPSGSQVALEPENVSILPATKATASTLPQGPHLHRMRKEIDDAIEDLRCAQEKTKRDRWKYTNRHGEEVEVAKRIQRILEGAEKYSNIVDIAIQHSPEITALVWAGARAILANTLQTALKELYDAVWAFTKKAGDYFKDSASIGHLFKPFLVVMQPLLDEIAEKEQVEAETLWAQIAKDMAPLTKFEVTELLSVTSENLSVSKRMDMRLQRIEDRLAPENVTALETHQREVLGMSLDESLLRLKDDYLTEHEMEEFQYNLYVPVEATEQPYADERVDLLQCVQDFIRGTKQICLIQGSAGSGKSTFNHYLARHLWSEYERASKQTEAAIPLFISLTSIVSSKPDSEDLIASYFSDRDFTEQDINLARRTRRFVFMLDGYDEIERRDCNFYAKNKLSRWKAKIIITSRPEYLGSGYHSKFHPPNKRELLQEYWLAPFSTDTIKSYITRFLQAKPTGRPAVDYEAYLTQPEIRDMISNPFLLRIIMTVEPSMDHEILINRVDLYKQFFGHCLAKAQSRLDNIQLTSDQRRIFQRLCDETFSDHAEQFCRDFALELYRHKAVEVTYRPGTARAKALLNEFFIVDDPGVLDFVVEQATLEHELQQKLLRYVEKSKTDDLVVQGAANALTVLVKSGMRFTGYDLRGIQVPRADLRFGWFDGAQLQGSDLRHVRLQGAWLRGANLSESKMAGVWFGERPAIGGSIMGGWPFERLQKTMTVILCNLACGPL
ncbi:hypothetical protein BDZ91DRAFT_768638 [Kalaharituber pfeilii]|nr:hypothetical protein BDZ91DRAFT_768638 [Kalaharituber pfeilii]